MKLPRFLLFPLIAVLSVGFTAPLAGCVTTTGGPAFSIPGVTQTSDEKALIAVQRTYKVLGTAYMNAYKAGWRGEDQARAKHILLDALVAITKARDLKRQGDLSGFTAQLGLARSTLSSVPAIPGSP